MENAQADLNAIKAEKFDAVVKCFAEYSRDDIDYLKNGYHIFEILDEVVNGRKRKS